MPSRFMVSWAARAVGMTRGRPSASIAASVVGGDGLDLRHDQVRPLGLDHRAQGAPASVMAIDVARCATCWPGASA